ncbi:MAG: hypothetical protein G01um101456_118 [Parcubacteria group bacterium Gr01-1014_56]|nr:MAG: hypothetical protein G01um101456_118 [Parcubacteria group bacterium Gr01-1014_56]
MIFGGKSSRAINRKEGHMFMTSQQTESTGLPAGWIKEFLAGGTGRKEPPMQPPVPTRPLPNEPELDYEVGDVVCLTGRSPITGEVKRIDLAKGRVYCSFMGTNDSTWVGIYQVELCRKKSH